MKYLMLTVLTGLFIINPLFAENDKKETKGQQERKIEHKKRKNAPKPWSILKNISGEERERLRKLYATNPAEFKEEIAKIVKRAKAAREEKHKQNQKIKQLVSQYQNANDDKTKKEAMEQLQKIVRKIFLAKMEENRKRLESLEKHVKKIRKAYDFRQKNADKIIQARLDTLTQDTNFEW